MTSKQQDWADISDDDEEGSVPTIQLDSVDLSSLSLSDKGKAAPAGKHSFHQEIYLHLQHPRLQ
jgi:hypothetical protein